MDNAGLNGYFVKLSNKKTYLSFHSNSAIETPVLFIYVMLSYHRPNLLVQIFCNVKANGVDSSVTLLRTCSSVACREIPVLKVRYKESYTA